jgi:hypothetical protein
MSRQHSHRRAYRVPYFAPGPGEWLKRSAEAFNAGLEAAKNDAPQSPSPYRHPGLREMWLAGYEAVSEPEVLFRELRLKGQLPWEVVNQFPWESDYCQVFKEGMLAALGDVDLESRGEQDVVLQEFWLAGYEYIKDPERTHNCLREQNWTNLGTPESEIERLQADVKKMLEGE